MTRAPDTGESTASIVARSNDEAWLRALPLLRAGARLTRPSPKLTNFYVNGNCPLTPARVKRLEREGKLRRVGVDVYELAESAGA